LSSLLLALDAIVVERFLCLSHKIHNNVAKNERVDGNLGVQKFSRLGFVGFKIWRAHITPIRSTHLFQSKTFFSPDSFSVAHLEVQWSNKEP
jgi:hypothetical protein